MKEDLLSIDTFIPFGLIKKSGYISAVFSLNIFFLELNTNPPIKQIAPAIFAVLFIN